VDGGRDVSELLPILIGATGLSEWDIRLILANAPSRYKHFKIKKRNGEDRKIAQPARELKALQRALIASKLAKLPVHEAATAYRSGVSIADNASAHAGNGPILKYDFQDFFPSIRSNDWRKYCKSNSVFDNEEDLWISERILFQRDKGSRILKLSIGAPSSPIVSNILMHRFDTLISHAVASDKVTYTRYADDLTFSAPRTGFLTQVESILRKAVRATPWPRLVINEKKTVLATPKYRRQVTGLILANDGKISIGRDKKRAVRAALHRAQHDRLTEQELSHLCGMLAFINSVEPEFVTRMEKHYGLDLLQRLKRYASVSRRPQVRLNGDEELRRFDGAD
jgi:RNA-directed DNA polymerase